MAIQPIIQIGVNNENGQLVLNTESTDALALLEVLVKAQQTIINSLKIPTPEQIIIGEEKRIIT